MDKQFRHATGDRTQISMVIPCFNESDGVDHLFQMLSRVDKDVGDLDIEYLLVDDGSSDDTFEKLQEKCRTRDNAVLLRHRENRGLTAAILTGLAFSTRPIVCSIDSDCTYDPRQLPDLLVSLDDDVDVVTASPYHPMGSVLGVPTWRLVLSRFASSLYRACMKTRLYCYTSCFRVYRRRAVVGLNVKNTGYVGIAEMLWRAEQADLKVVEAPAALCTRKFGTSKMKLLNTTLEHLRLLSEIVMTRLGGDVQQKAKPLDGPGKVM